MPQKAVTPAFGSDATSSTLVFRRRRFKIRCRACTLLKIQRVKDRLLREELKAANQLLLLCGHLEFAQRLLRFQRFFAIAARALFLFEIRGSHLLQILLQPLQALLDLRQVRNHQIEFDILDIAQRIDRSHVRNRVVFESA